MAEMMLQASAIFSTVNVLFLLVLIAIYGNSLRKVRAEFTVGLLFFAAMFLLQNLIALYSYAAMFMYFAPGVGTLVFAVTLAQSMGLAVLVWLSLR